MTVAVSTNHRWRSSKTPPPPNYMQITFTYDKKIDESCWERYNKFIELNGSVWGLQRQYKKIVNFQEVKFTADVTDIIDKYTKLFGLTIPIINGYFVTTPFSMINDDRIEFSDTIFYSFYTPNTYMVLAHEIFHMFFERYTKKDLPNYEETKEYFTVIMNDLFDMKISTGYPEHQEIRDIIFESWKKNQSLDDCIKVVHNL
jgi:hypothetical protein